MRSIHQVGTAVVAEVLGTRIAWWQLGFAARRAVRAAARAGDPLADRDVWAVAVDWGRLWLAAPWWWRLAWDGGVALLAAVCLAAFAVVMAEVDGVVAAGGAVTACVPLAACWGGGRPGTPGCWPGSGLGVERGGSGLCRGCWWWP